MSGFSYPKGSEWRKWDLHVHTPESVHNQFEGKDKDEKWGKFLDAVEATDISVLGATDYFSIEGYRILKENKKNGRLKDIDLILPNVELRIIPVTDDNRAINLHFIFSPDIVDELESKFFSKLKFHYADEDFYCVKDNLVKLGRTYKGDDSLEEHKAYEEGILQFKTNIDDLRDIFDSYPRLKERTIVAVSNSNKDGASGIQHSSLAATREGVYRFADIIFSGNPSDRIYFLGDGSDPQEEIKRKYTCLKPCIHGSDAHSIDRIGNPDHNRFCWIKADPNFEGLKQVIYEPDERVHIGEEPPEKFDREKVLKSIKIQNSNNWFEDKTIELNDGLISVIGGKGTGKTALLDLLAYTTGGYEKDERSFLKKAIKELKGASLIVEWDDDSQDEIEIEGKIEPKTEERKIRYLSQSFVEKLCSVDGRENLKVQIENVIFQNIPKEQKASYSNFKDYKNAQLKVITDKKNRVRKQLDGINFRIYETNELISKKKDFLAKIEKTESESTRIKKELDRLSSSLKGSEEQKRKFDDYNKLNERKSELEQEVSRLNSLILKVEDIENKIFQLTKDFTAFVEELKTDLHTIQVESEIIDQVELVLYPQKIREKIKEKKRDFRINTEEKKSELEELEEKIKRLTEELDFEKSKQKKIEDLNNQLGHNKGWLESLKNDLRKIEEAEQYYPNLTQERKDLFGEFLDILFEEKNKLTEIYSPISSDIEENTEKSSDLFEFSAKFNFDFESMVDKGDKLIDHNKRGRFYNRTKSAFKDEINDQMFEINSENKNISDHDKNSVNNFLEEVERLFLKDKDGNKHTIASQLKKKYTEYDFYNWLYSTDYYYITYSIKFNDVELENLSPGQRGVALLILYLDLDKEDTRPILIDQPEENLDNRSVYEILVDYFRKAKKRRQVITVTHNPNLVVNTDSEQIIVANFDKERMGQSSFISYVSGSLENTFIDNSVSSYLEKQGIREHICEILEGGKEAFEKREQKYGFQR